MPMTRSRSPRSFLAESEGDREDFRLQSLPMAGIAKDRVHEPFQAIPGKFAFTFLVESFQVWNHSLKRPAYFAHFAGAPEGKLDLSRTAAVQQRVLKIVRQTLVRGFQVL